MFWEMGASEETDAAAPDEARLRSYLAGELSDAEQEKLETDLARSPAGRQRLAELAGIEVERPSPRVRERVLAALPEASAQGGDSQPSDPTQRAAWRWPGARTQPLTSHRRRRTWRTAAAAAAVLLLAITGYRWLGPAGETVVVADFELAATALASDRSAAPYTGSESAPSSVLHAYPSTRISIRATSESANRGAVDYAIYRLEEDRLVRIELEPTLFRYGGEFEAPARQMVGERPGRYRLYVAAAAHGDLPRSVAVVGEPLDALRAATGGPVHRLAPLDLLAEAQQQEPG
jgi:hypothetical protein